jgi:D-aminoacyl-tRNA deacylase
MNLVYMAPSPRTGEAYKGAGDQDLGDPPMHIAIVNSALDPAGVAIRRQLLELLDNPAAEPVSHCGNLLSFVETADRLIYEEGLDGRVDADLILFVSRHTSTRPEPALTVHVTGNYGGAIFGGRKGELAVAAPAWMHAILREMAARAPAGYRVSYEVTHHGPTDLATPSLFAEIGSTEAEWRDPAAARAVAASILAAAPGAALTLIGFGGTHYAARQTAIALATPAAFGHIAHSREVAGLDAPMVRQMREKSGAQAAYIDRKALPGAVLSRLEALLAEQGIVALSESEIHAIGDLAWEDYAAIRRLAEETAPDSRISVHAMAGRGDPVAFEIPEEVLAEALRVDRGRFLRRLDALPVVHLSSSTGKMLPIFISYDKNRSTLIDELITLSIDIVTGEANNSVDGERLILRKRRFNPKKARMLGVPQGPLFKELASGNAVELDGRLVTPEMVSEWSERAIHVPGLERYL